ncbi:pyruvate formate lyase activating enzyme [Propionibacterium cyclohexanicum]|uniref:Pyruvate formate-lyase-activating enzyme n=1 Tax=Propionibacterium cyclohexanicum TaxID=64702 RepID=A0A1H9TK95_9ACTN|nr:pyruvate formate-lyase-activating protein [Propionibacterium cyclohexanicum]SER97571.1 pyruvate formate lyase activating enzyme [Propionibacterium cyclohexanicum]
MRTGAPTASRRLAGGIPTAEELSRAELAAALQSGEVGMVHSWELVTAVDGPGTRMTTFLAGCPLRCLYCHNPDTWSMRRGTPVRASELLARVRRYRSVFRSTGGGITLSGGEALMQPQFVSRVFAGARELGVHTALDTSGVLGARADDALLAETDLVLLDVKAGDALTYRRVTGGELAPTLDFGRRLSAHGIEIWIRFVLVPDLTDAPETAQAVAEYASGLASVSRVEVLPFHQMGRGKWHELGIDYALENTAPPSVELLAATRAIFAARGLTVY